MTANLQSRRPTILVAWVAWMAIAAEAATITLDDGTSYQKISGFGASTAWGSSMSTADADQLWSTTTGAGLSLHRIRIAPDQTTSETNIAKMAIARGAKVWATPWTPPSSLKAGETKANVMGLLAKHQEYATRLVNFANTMKTNGVPLYAISAQNEPDATVDYESCRINPDSMALWVGKYLGPAFAGTDIKVMSPETQNWYGMANYWPKLKADADFMKYTSIIATHEYGGAVKAYPDIAQAGKEFWQTEIYDTQGPADPGMGSALRVFKLIHEALTIANMNAWHFWWVYPSTTDNGALWDKATNKASKRLWVMGNFSRFVRPGSVRIAATGTPASGVSVSAYRVQSSTIVAVVANTNTSSVVQDFTVRGAATASVTPYVTDETRNLAALTKEIPSSSVFGVTLPPRSVTTVVVDIRTGSVLPSPSRAPEPLVAERIPGGWRFALDGRPASRIELRGLDGTLVSSHDFPAGSTRWDVPAPDTKGILEARLIEGDQIRTTKLLNSK